MQVVATYRTAAHKPVDQRASIKASYFLVIVKYHSTFNALYPDVPGCVALSRSLDEVRAHIVKGLEIHLTSMMEDAEPWPVAKTTKVAELDPDEKLVETGFVDVRMVEKK
jgi:predicted RNase H-like HicB family nuclease